MFSFAWQMYDRCQESYHECKESISKVVITSLDLIHIVTIIIKQKTISMLKIARPVSFLLLSAALCSSGTVFAANETATPKVGISQQQKSLKGTVNDVLGPVAGASVVVKGTTNGTVTDMEKK